MVISIQNEMIGRAAAAGVRKNLISAEVHNNPSLHPHSDLPKTALNVHFSANRMARYPDEGSAIGTLTPFPRGNGHVEDGVPLTADVRTALIGQRGSVLWLTGLSGAGKSTLAVALERKLLRAGILPVILDGDVLRMGLCQGLGFSEADRKENIRRAAEAALLVAESGAVVIVALISPYRADREMAAERCHAKGIPFAEIYVNAPLAECERRDPKHLYARVRAGEIPLFTGISSPYEHPLSPTLELHTDRETVEESAAKLTTVAISLARPDRRARYVSQLIGAEAVLHLRRNQKSSRLLRVFTSTFEAVLRSLFSKI
jgi:adenylyl-sulfate kinase